MSVGGRSIAERQPFVDAARFVCTLLGPAPLGVMVLDSHARCVAANATLGTLSRQTLDADRLEGVEIRWASAELAAAFGQTLRGEIAMVETDVPPVLGSGQGLWRLHFLPFVVEREQGAALLFEDLTEHRLAAEAFQAAEQRFRLLVDSASDGIVIYRAQILLYVNPEAVCLFGYQSPDDLVGRPLLELVDAEHRSSFELRMREVDIGNGPGLFETAMLRCDGTSFPVECRTSRARVDEMGAGFLFFNDITDRKRIQTRRENARRVDALSRLSVSVGTELKGYASMLRRWSARIKTTGTSGRELSDLGELIESMNQRADAFLLPKVQELEVAASTTVEELMVRVCNTAMVAIGAATEGAESRSELVVDLEPAPYAVRGDSGTIETGLTTLARAALRARVAGAPLRIRGSRGSAADDQVRPLYRLSISSGRAKSQRASQLGNALTFPPNAWAFGSWEQGQDLEILAAFAALQAQGCWVETQSCPGGGLDFTVELSLDPNRLAGGELESIETASTIAGTDEMATDERSPDTERSHRESAPPDQRSAPVLICDDEPRLVALTAGLLREFGFEVLTVRSGKEAIQAVASHPIDIVILDVNLPGEDARQIVSGLREKSTASIILSSGYTEEDIEPSLLQDSAVKAFLAKPYGVETLVDTIDQVRLRAKQEEHGVDDRAAKSADSSRARVGPDSPS